MLQFYASTMLDRFCTMEGNQADARAMIECGNAGLVYFVMMGMYLYMIVYHMNLAARKWSFMGYTISY